jgi:beta-glucosidase
MDVHKLISQMTLEEKASLCSGKNYWYLQDIERLAIPAIMVADGPHGLRKQASDPDHWDLSEAVPATCFPTAAALAATWNRDLVYQVGEALGQECRQEKVGVILGPGVNIKRSPLCGRNFEYFSEDPYLTGEMAKSHINGVQSQGIGTSLKHYAVNNQEFRRMTINAIVDERTLREIYLTGYEIAVKEAQPWMVMCAYNKINGTYASDHQSLMRDILKDEWGHAGLVITDWGAMNDRPIALEAGTELEMPGPSPENDQAIVAAVQSGQLDEAVLDQSVERILKIIFRAAETLAEDYTYNLQSHHALARKVAGEGAVLLKNDRGLLPLADETKIALIGRFAKEPIYQGGGSSKINPTQVDNLYDEIVKLLGDAQLTYAPGYSKKAEQPDDALVQEAIALAKNADVVVICAGLTDLYETEGGDRTHMKMPPGHDALISAVAAVHANVVVVLSNGSPVEMPWASDIPAILEGYLGGQAGAGVLADILFGKLNPSGKLAETFPIKLEDNPSYHYFPGGPATVEYRESLYVGYRYYDSVDQEVLFPFGHGLSYTTFEYRDLQLDQDHLKMPDPLSVSFKVKNTGAVAGQEIVQVYVSDVESTVFRPDKELKGFAKVALEPGAEQIVTIELRERAFAYYNTAQKDWQVETGEFKILVGASSRDIRLQGTVTVHSKQAAPTVDWSKLTTYYNFPKGTPVNQVDFEVLLGRSAPLNKMPPRGSYDLNTPIGEMRDSFIARWLHNMLKKHMSTIIQGQEDTSMNLMEMEAILNEMPLRAMMISESDGQLSRAVLEALVVMINGRFFKGLGALIKAIRMG